VHLSNSLRSGFFGWTMSLDSEQREALGARRRVTYATLPGRQVEVPRVPPATDVLGSEPCWRHFLVFPQHLQDQLNAQRLLRLVCHKLSLATESFFSPVDGVVVNDDPLVAVAQHDRHAATSFIKVTMFLSSVGNCVICGICAAFLHAYWSCCANCNRPMRVWLLVYIAVTLCQSWVRFVVLVKVHHAEADEAGTGGMAQVLACIESVTRSPAWSVSKRLSLFTFGWLVLGSIWSLNSLDSPACAVIARCSLVVIFQAGVRSLVCLYIFHRCFPQGGVDQEEISIMKGATEEQIAALRCCEFSADLVAKEDNGCAICLSDYEVGDLLRWLPCQHHFHQVCADQWLQKSNCCPLCRQCVETAESRTDRTGAGTCPR